MQVVISVCVSHAFSSSAHSASISRFHRHGFPSSWCFILLRICCFSGPFGSRACCHVV